VRGEARWPRARGIAAGRRGKAGAGALRGGAARTRLSSSSRSEKERRKWTWALDGISTSSRGLSGSGAARLVAATIMVAHARERSEEVSEEETTPWTT